MMLIRTKRNWLARWTIFLRHHRGDRVELTGGALNVTVTLARELRQRVTAYGEIRLGGRTGWDVHVRAGLISWLTQ